MDGELVTDPLSARSNERGGGDKGRQPLLRYKKIIEDAFPFYLSIGMTPEMYWDGDATLSKFYRKAYELKRERKNEEMWLQGLYIYEALLDSAPVLNAFCKTHKPLPYRSEPIPLTEDEVIEMREKEEERKLKENKEKFKELVKELNKKFERKEDIEDGD